MAKRLVALALTLMAAMFPAAWAADGGKDTTNRQIPDPAYIAKRGDEAYLVGYDRRKHELYPAFAAFYSFAYHEHWKALAIKDYDETGESVERGTAAFEPIGTACLVIEIEHFEAPDPRPTCAIVRIQDGPDKGKKVWVSRFQVVRSIDNPDYVGRKR